MAVNETLAKIKNISLENKRLISGIHDYLELIISMEVPHGFNKEIYEEIETLEFELQRLWGWTQSEAHHTWKHEYKFKCEWAGRKFMCLDTGVEFTIPLNVQETEFFSIGNSALDVGRSGQYHRVIGNLKEITNE